MLFFSMLSILDNNERNCAEQIFDDYHKLIYEVSYKILNNREDAEDTLDEVMINVIKNIHKFVHASRNDIEAQLVIYSRNAAINLYNKNKRRSKVIQSFTFVNDEDEIEEIDIPDDGQNIDELILSKETSEMVGVVLRKLSIEYRDVIELVYGMGYSNVEAAHVLGITPNTVGLRLMRAKRKLLELAEGDLHERI